MMAVIVGTALQLREDGIGSPSAIFLISMLSSFFVAALLHPQEFGCIIFFSIYLLSIPSMYLLLILYSIINLNNVTWGTREVQVKKTKQVGITFSKIRILRCKYLEKNEVEIFRSRYLTHHLKEIEAPCRSLPDYVIRRVILYSVMAYMLR